MDGQSTGLSKHHEYKNHQKTNKLISTTNDHNHQHAEPSPFAHYQAESGLDESRSWEASNKTTHKDEQPKILYVTMYGPEQQAEPSASTRNNPKRGVRMVGSRLQKNPSHHRETMVTL
ncbi:hypothetical protein L195_g009272 [Trifolium pratense]|uniref:Uncharacterized protein n=1 Tax=Trifolium pratense TaxID=57577 RepID=A0A2K3PBH8_TRIPR|nr:hypothetical protein L195_g009272 [Trifolium pratense]